MAVGDPGGRGRPGVPAVVAQGGFVPVAPQNLALLCLAASTLILGYLTIVKAMRVGDIASVAPFRYTALLWAILLGWLFFGERCPSGA